MAATAYSFARENLPCPQCKQNSSHLVSEIIGRDSVPCIYCEAPINLQNDEDQAALKEAAYITKRIRIDNN